MEDYGEMVSEELTVPSVKMNLREWLDNYKKKEAMKPTDLKGTLSQYLT